MAALTPDGPAVVPTWVTSRKAVNAFERFCVDQQWVFVEVDGQSDFGKDGYVDLGQEGVLDGLCIAVQIKGGASFRRMEHYAIPADSRRRALWAQSNVPVFAVVWDPTDDQLYWLNLTDTLVTHGLDAALKVPRTNRMCAEALGPFLEDAWRGSSGSPALAGLGSHDVDRQRAAIWDCYAIGRKDARYLTLVRRAMFGLHPESIDAAIHVLNTCSLNGDNFHHESWMSMEVRREVRISFEWSVDQAVELLDRVSDDGDGYFGRATFGSCVYWLIVGNDLEGDSFVSLVASAVCRAAELNRPHAAAMGLLLWLYWESGRAPEILRDFLEAHPGLAEDSEVKLLRRHIEQFGRIQL